jgi:phosphatidylserine/phosphatidylglycerophosphate/cardiolipin synthase-like enzyme
MSAAVTVRTLTDGGQQPLDVAGLLADFIGSARESLAIAQYDFHLGAETAEVMAGAIRGAAHRGVDVRILYNVDHPFPVPVPPPPEPDAVLIQSLAVSAKAVSGVPDLMHHKYVVRDAESVLTGSANWTDDSWARQENVIAIVSLPELAEAYAANFDELWTNEVVARSGLAEAVTVGGTRAWFTPGHGEALSYRIGRAIARASRRVRICSPVITAAPILGALAQTASERRIDLAGCVDATQLTDVIRQWHANGNAAWKLPLLQRAMRAPFAGKRSTRWSPDSIHDFMHAKVTVADDTVFTGSFNLSRSGEKNAENVVEIHDAELAGRLADYVDAVRSRYPPFRLP